MIAPLQYITQDIPGCSAAMLVEAACASGVEWVQLRLKNKPYETWKKEALNSLTICRHYGARLIINDNVVLAQEIGADGVHVGRLDMPPAQARQILGPGFIIGATANTFDDIRDHAAAGVDYIGLGPYRFTATKEDLSPLLGLEGYTCLMHQCRESDISLPIIAIGGITLPDVGPLLGAGVQGIAVSSALSKSENKKAAVSGFLTALAEAQKPLKKDLV
jgi:thiamine-phosphate pyrophosphorylase